MHDALVLGPFLLPFSLLLVFASAGTSVVVGRYVGKRSGVDPLDTLWTALLVGAVVARLAFVLEYKNLYFSAPLSIVDIRDGGWNAIAGLFGSWFYAFHRYQKDPALRQSLQRGLLAGTLLFAVGTSVLVLRPGPGPVLPDIRLTTLQGQTVSLQAFAGRPTVVNLWATWCPPCVREMPVLGQAQRAQADVHFVFVNQGEDPAHVARWMQGRRLALDNVLFDGKREASAVFKQKGYPTTLFFNADGQLVDARIGELSAATLEQHLARARD